MYKTKILIVSLILFLISAGSVSAGDNVPGSSAQLTSRQHGFENDPRVRILRASLDSYNSPLAEYAQEFVEASDKYGLDWRLVPAISGVESTFGKRIPYNSYNAYGWANGYYSFESWNDSIEVVSSTLREKYIDRGAVSINQIARRYAPPSKAWAGKVKFFMRRIDPYPVTFTI